MTHNTSKTLLQSAIILQYFDKSHLFNNLISLCSQIIIQIMTDRGKKPLNDNKTHTPCYLYAWGVNYFKPTEIHKNVTYISAGENHAVFGTSIGECFGIGENRFGQLGIQNLPNCTTPVQIFSEVGKFNTVQCGAQHTFVLTNKNEVYATGMNIKGQLGLGNFDNVSKLKLIPSLLPHGQKNPKASNKDIMKKMKLPIYNILQSSSRVQVKYEDEELEIHETLLQPQQIIQHIACGVLHTLVLSNKGRVFGCGYQNISTNTDEYLDRAAFRQISFQKPIKSISCGLSGSCALTIDGTAYAWGRFGKVVFNTPTIMKSILDNIRQDKFTEAKVGDGFIVMLNKGGDIYTIGENIHGELGNQELFHDKPTRVIKTPICRNVFAGRNYCLSIGQEDNRLYGWGHNQDGQLLQGNRTISVIKGCTDLGINIESNQNVTASSFCTYVLKKQPLDDKTDKNYKEHQQQIVDIKQYKRLQHQFQLLKNLNLSLIQKTIKPILVQQVTQTISKFQVQGVTKHRTFDSNLEINWNELQIQKQIAEGGYGLIYKAKWRETIVAVKKFKIQNGDVGLRDFLSECHAMEAVRHPNIVMFLGVCTKPPHYCIVLQYCSNGSLWSILQSHEIKLPWDERRRIAIEIARAVLYLHLCTPPIMHRDLKSLNILLDDNFRVKIADFGWTKMLTEYMSCKIGTYQWMAPQVINSNNYSEKADVFSYAIILWEIASRQPPYKNIKGHEVSQQVLANNLRPTIPKNVPEPFSKLMKQCWDTIPQKRPNFKQIIKQLQAMKLPNT